MTELKFKIGKEELKAVLEEEKAPLTCEFFKKMLPIIHIKYISDVNKMSKKFLSIIVAAEMLFEVYEILQNGTN